MNLGYRSLYFFGKTRAGARFFSTLHYFICYSYFVCKFRRNIFQTLTAHGEFRLVNLRKIIHQAITFKIKHSSTIIIKLDGSLKVNFLHSNMLVCCLAQLPKLLSQSVNSFFLFLVDSFEEGSPSTFRIIRGDAPRITLLPQPFFTNAFIPLSPTNRLQTQSAVMNSPSYDSNDFTLTVHNVNVLDDTRSDIWSSSEALSSLSADQNLLPASRSWMENILEQRPRDMKESPPGLRIDGFESLIKLSYFTDFRERRGHRIGMERLNLNPLIAGRGMSDDCSRSTDVRCAVARSNAWTTDLEAGEHSAYSIATARKRMTSFRNTAKVSGEINKTSRKGQNASKGIDKIATRNSRRKKEAVSQSEYSEYTTLTQSLGL